MQALLTLLLSEKIGADVAAPSTPRSSDAEAVRKKIRDGLESGNQN
jgi:hypothetical protein